MRGLRRSVRVPSVASRILCCGSLLAACAWCSANEPDDDTLRRALAVVVAAQPRGAGSEELAAAWRTLVQASNEQLPMVLQAVDEADALGANWISMALDGIVQRQADTGRQLPMDAVTNVALDFNRSLRTRKMALDLLAACDAGLVADLQMQMMQDPEAELRRPAIERAMERLSGEGGQAAAPPQQVSAWLDILAAARDQDQVLRIAGVLKGLGHEVNLDDQFGYLVDWYVIGPFDNAGGQHFHTPYPPEELTWQGFEDIVTGQAQTVAGSSGPVAWKKVRARPNSGDVDLNQEIEKLRDVLGYGATVFDADRAMPVDIRLRIQNAFKVWLNGKLLIEQPVGHTGNSFDQYRVRAQLRPGPNLLVVKSCQVNLQGATEFYDNWHFCVRMCDATGAGIRQSRTAR